jgi:hypothetical protein
MKITVNNLKKIRPSDFMEFTWGIPSMEAVDVLCDARFGFTSTAHTLADGTLIKNPSFFEPPGAFVYQLDLTVDSDFIQENFVEGLNIDFYRQDPRLTIKQSGDDIAGKQTGKAAELVDKLLEKVKPDFSVDVFFANDLERSAINTSELQSFKNVKAPMKAMFAEKPMTVGKKTAQPIFYNQSQISAEKTSGLNFSMEVKKEFSSGIDPLGAMCSFKGLAPTGTAKLSLGSYSTESEPEDVIAISSEVIVGSISLKEQRQILAADSMAPCTSVTECKISNLASDYRPGKPNAYHNLGYVAAVVNNKLRVRRNIHIPKRVLKSYPHFFLRITPMIKSGAFSSSNYVVNTMPVSETNKIPHKDSVMELLRPVISPEISVITVDRNQVELRIINRDPVATSVLLSRRIFDYKKGKISGLPGASRRFNLSFEPGKNEILCIDDISAASIDASYPNRVYYEASSVNDDEQAGPSKSIFVPGPMPVISPGNERLDDVKIIAVNEKSGIKVLVSNIDPEITLAIAREDLNQIGASEERTKIVKRNDFLSAKDSKSTEFLDKKVHENGNYRYFCILRRSGTEDNRRVPEEYRSEADCIVRRRYPKKPFPVAIDVSAPAFVMSDEGRMEISFDISTEMRSEGYEFLTKLLKDTGVEGYFLEEVRKQKSQIADILAFSVERFNNTTGERIHYGLMGAGKFVDTNRSIGPGQKYIYFVKVHMRSPESFFKNLFSSFTGKNQTSGVTVHKVLSKKFLDPFTARFGVLPSDYDLRKDSSVKEQLEAAETGITIPLDISTPKNLAFPSDLSFSYSRGQNFRNGKIKWRIKGGSRNNVAKCLVYCEYGGLRRLIGAVAAHSRTNTYYFIDEIYVSQVGRKIYSVRLMYNDFSLSRVSNTAVIDRESSLPPTLTGGRIIGDHPQRLDRGRNR